MKIKCYLIRHGQTPANRRHSYLGWTEAALSAEGRMQIASLKEKMTGLEQPEIVFTSPMQRCRESAQILFPDKEKIEIPEWKEMNFGAFEGKNYEQLNGNPQYQAWIDSNGTLPFPEGESRVEFIDRVCAGMENAVDYLRNYAQSNMCRDCGSDREVTVAAVVHGGTIMALLSHYGGGDYYDYQVENAGGFSCRILIAGEQIRFVTQERGFR